MLIQYWISCKHAEMQRFLLAAVEGQLLMLVWNVCAFLSTKMEIYTHSKPSTQRKTCSKARNSVFKTHCTAMSCKYNWVTHHKQPCTLICSNYMIHAQCRHALWILHVLLCDNCTVICWNLTSIQLQHFTVSYSVFKEHLVQLVLVLDNSTSLLCSSQVRHHWTEGPR